MSMSGNHERLMNVRLLVIDDEARGKVQKVINYSAKPENWYNVFPGGKTTQEPPGHNYRHCVNLDTYRCVFSFTHDHGADKVFRHLSISVPTKDKYAHILAAFMIADLFLFEGWDGTTIDKPPDGWLLKVDEKDHCIVLAQATPAIII